MNPLINNSLIQTTAHDLKIFLIKELTEHPIRTIALAILFPITAIALCVWTIKKAYSLKNLQETLPAKETIDNSILRHVSNIAFYTGCLAVGLFGVYSLVKYSSAIEGGAAPINNRSSRTDEVLDFYEHDSSTSLKPLIANFSPVAALTNTTTSTNNLTAPAFEIISRVGSVFNHSLNETVDYLRQINVSNISTTALELLAKNLSAGQNKIGDAIHLLLQQNPAVEILKSSPLFNNLFTHTILGTLTDCKDSLSSLKTTQFLTQNWGAIIFPAALAVDPLLSLFDATFKSPLLKTKSIKFDAEALKIKIRELEVKANTHAGTPNAKVYTNKAALLKNALNKIGNQQPDIQMTTLKNPNIYKFTPNFWNRFSSLFTQFNKIPQHFNEKWTNRDLQSVKISATDAFYTYSKKRNMFNAFVDFANKHLGGGWDGRGYVQEEVMVFEMPGFAALLTKFKNLMTRMDHSRHSEQGVLEGSPNPILLEGVVRVQKSPPEAYGRGLETATTQSLINRSTRLNFFPNVSVLAIAAPNLGRFNDEKLKNNKQTDLATLMDIYNTLAAGIDLVKLRAQEQNLPPFLHSGKLGAGVFGNSPEAVYLLHCLVSGRSGVPIKLYGYSNEEVKDFQKSWGIVSGTFENKSIKDCIALISVHLRAKFRAQQMAN